MGIEEIRKEPIFMMKNLYSGTSKLRMDSEIALPDYKEDAGRIIRSDMRGIITNKNTYLQGQFVFCDIEGILITDILYIAEKRDDNSSVSSYKAETPFTHSVKIPVDCDDPSKADTLISVCEINCENNTSKLTGPRKIAIKSDLNFDISIKCNMIDELYGESEIKGFEKKTKDIKLANIVQSTDKNFKLEEKIILPKEYMPIADILSANADIAVTKCENKDGITSFSGILSIYCSYISQEDNSLISFYQPIEFSEEIESESFADDSFTELKLISGDIGVSLDQDDENSRSIDIIAPFEAICNVYKNENAKICTDIYSTDNILYCETEKKEFDKISALFKEKAYFESDIELKQDDIRSAESIKTEIKPINSYFEDNKMIIEGRCCIHFAGVRNEGALIGIDDYFNFKTEIAKPDFSSEKEYGAEITSSIVSCEIGILKNKCKVKINSVFDIMLTEKEKLDVLKSIDIGEERKRDNSEIRLYYPDKDEKLWDICKNYGKSISDIKKVNAIENDDVLPNMLKII